MSYSGNSCHRKLGLFYLSLLHSLVTRQVLGRNLKLLVLGYNRYSHYMSCL